MKIFVTVLQVLYPIFSRNRTLKARQVASGHVGAADVGEGEAGMREDDISRGSGKSIFVLFFFFTTMTKSYGTD